MIVVVIAYDVFAFSPIIFSAFLALRRRTTMQRKLLFVGSVMAMTYGLLLVFLVAICVPVAAFMIFVVPQLRSAGYLENSWLIAIADFAYQWWWVVLPPALAATAVLVTRYLGKRWNSIVHALQG